jgi:hypothetical protein
MPTKEPDFGHLKQRRSSANSLTEDSPGNKVTKPTTDGSFKDYGGPSGQPTPLMKEAQYETEPTEK